MKFSLDVELLERGDGLDGGIGGRDDFQKNSWFLFVELPEWTCHLLTFGKLKKQVWGRIGERPRDYFGNPKYEMPDELPNGES